jgi:hypothetical protein
MLQRFKPQVHVDRRNGLAPILLGPKDEVLFYFQLVNGLSPLISCFVLNELPIDVEPDAEKFWIDLSDIFSNFFKFCFNDIFKVIFALLEHFFVIFHFFFTSDLNFCQAGDLIGFQKTLDWQLRLPSETVVLKVVATSGTVKHQSGSTERMTTLHLLNLSHLLLEEKVVWIYVLLRNRITGLLWNWDVL